MKNLFTEPRQKIYNFSIFDPIKIFFSKKIGEDNLRDFFSTKLGFKNSLSLSHNRLGIYLSVKAIIEKNKNEIILSPYTIIDVVNMVICAGAKPIFVDVDFPSISISSNEVKKKINIKTAGIIITHYHSYCENFSEISTLAKESNIKIIEDCAIVFGSKIDKNFVGIKSDIAVFSFNITKFISTLTGGLLICKDDNLFAKVKDYSNEFKINPFFYLFLKYINAVQIKFFTSKIVFNLFTRWIIKFTADSKVRIFKNLVRTDGEKKMLTLLTKKHKIFVSNYQRKEIYFKVSKYLDKYDQKTRLENYVYYQNNLSSLTEIQIHKINLDNSNAAISFPIFYKYRDKLHKYLIMKNCDVTKYFYRDCSSLEIFNQYKEQCLNSARACNEVILLPVYPGYSMRSIQKNIDTIKLYFKENNYKV